MAKARRSSPLTLAEFVATGKDVADISRVRGFRDEPPGPARVYVGTLYIAGGPGDWVLTIETDQTESATLEPLERELYEFALAEGHCS